MKLNEKHLVGFASGSAPVDKEGFLMKRGEVNKAFQKRYFVLKGNLLFYYEKKGDKEPIGVVILEGCTVELSENSDLYTFELVFQGSGTRTYVLAAESQEEMEAWMKAVACAGYDYMRLMVAELHRQMDEVTADQTGADAAAQTAAAVPTVPPRRTRRAGGEQTTSGGQQTTAGGGHLLLDLTVPDATSSQQSQRVNPFNSGQPQRPLDLFGATPFNESHYGSVASPRTFAQMHEDFGKYIKQKLSEHIKTEMLLDI